MRPSWNRQCFHPDIFQYWWHFPTLGKGKGKQRARQVDAEGGVGVTPRHDLSLLLTHIFCNPSYFFSVAKTGIRGRSYVGSPNVWYKVTVLTSQSKSSFLGSLDLGFWYWKALGPPPPLYLGEKRPKLSHRFQKPHGVLAKVGKFGKISWNS